MQSNHDYFMIILITIEQLINFILFLNFYIECYPEEWNLILSLDISNITETAPCEI